MDILTEQNKLIRNLISKQNKGIRKNLKEQKKGIIKELSNLKIKQFISKEKRERIPTKKRHEVENKYYNKCAVCKQKPRGVTLQFHHINGKNNDNRLSNLMLLCPNHHYGKHSKGAKLNKQIRRRGLRQSSSLFSFKN